MSFSNLYANAYNIYKIVSVLKSEEVQANMVFFKVENGEDPPKQKTHDADKDIAINLYRNLLKDESITLEVYISYISQLFEINRRKKLTPNEDLTDSDEYSTDSSDGECHSD
jgi:hypothetical protein